MRAHLFCFLGVACWFPSGAHRAGGAEPVSYRQAAALSPAEQNTLSLKAERGDSKAAFALALHYATVAPNVKNREYFLTLASKSGSRESIEALADFYSMPGGIFQMQKAISLRKDLKRKFPNEVDNIDWAEGLAFEYHYRTKEEARRKELAFLKLADSWGSLKAKETLQSMDVHGASSTGVSKVINKVSDPQPTVGSNDSFRIPAEEIRVLKRKAAQGDSQAAERLSLYYRIYRNDRKRELRYLKLGARDRSAVAVRNLMTIYCTDPGLFNFEKALGFRQQLKQLAGIDLQPDADWSYDLYVEHFWSAGQKSLGLLFLRYAAKHDSEKARNELIEIYSKDPDLRNPKKARYWEQRLVASKLAPTQTLALISNSAEQLPAGAARSGSAEFTPVNILGREGMIVPEAFLRGSGLPAEGFWTPKESQLREVERSLPTFLRREMQSRPSIRELHEVIASEPRYRRQYVGMIMDGRKVIWVNCIPQKPEEGIDPFTNWDRELVDVSDGGSSFWGVVYDTEKHSFDKLILNGSA